MKTVVVVGMLFAVPAFANSISEAMIMHEDAVYEIAAERKVQVVESKNFDFAEATEDNGFAIQNDVTFAVNGKKVTVNCVSQFAKTGRSFEITSTVCQ